MQRITWYALLAVVALVAPIGGQTPAPQTQMPRANVRELATIEGSVGAWVALPGGRTLIYSSLVPDAKPGSGARVEESTFAHDVATKRRTLLGTNMLPAAVSPQGDRLAFRRHSEDGTGDFVWTMPIDPRTGVATGQAQRVSLRPIDSQFLGAAFSPDGKTLAFDAGPRLPGMREITLVPATGGPERVVASYAMRRVSFAWSADGKSLYVQRMDSTKTAIDRVPVEGGPIEPWVPRTPGTYVISLGLSPDARVTFFDEDPDRFTYRTASGIEGEISVPLPPLDRGFGNDMSLDSRLRYTTLTQVQNQAVRVLDLATGKARDLLPGKVPSTAPAWSPDGRRIAVLSGNRSHYDITIVNGDGSSPRRYTVPMHLEGWVGPGVWEKPWSPDGRFLAFRAKAENKGRRTVSWSPHDESELGILDVNSGQTRVLTTSSNPIGRFVWRSDGNAVRTLKVAKLTPVPDGSPTFAGLSVVEIPLGGPERILREISAEFPRANDFVFASDRNLVVRVASDKGPDFFLVPLDGGTARRLPDAGTEPGLRTGASLLAGDLLLIAQIDERGESRAIKVLSTVGDATRTLRQAHSGYHSVVLPDGKQIISVGRAAGDSVYKLFLVPLDGSATRLIGEIPPGTRARLALSPDGKLLAYTPEGRPTTKIHEIDFGPALQAILKR